MEKCNKHWKSKEDQATEEYKESVFNQLCECQDAKKEVNLWYCKKRNK